MLLASHRGPVTFVRDASGGFEQRRGAGGVVSALLPLVAGTDTTWIAATITDDDIAAVSAGETPDGDVRARLLAIDPRLHRLHSDIVSNSVLWFVLHGLFDLPRRPVFDHRFAEAWEAYRDVNAQFAGAILEAAGDREPVVVHDYQLALVPGMLRKERPDLPVAFFLHTPFCGPNSIRVLPSDVSDELIGSMASVPVGFHTERWAAAYVASAREVLGDNAADVAAFTSPLGPSPADLVAVAGSEEARREGQRLDDLVGDRSLILRIDRIEPSKNIVRGFAAYDRLLDERPALRGRVVFLALAYPSRGGLADYQAYRQEVEQAATRVNERWATTEWSPVVLEIEDSYPRSIAALERYDVLLVNPLRDGLNLVAKEGPVLNRRDGVLALSRDAGAYAELGSATCEIHPYDIAQSAEALHTALIMPADERAERHGRLRALATAHDPSSWLADLVAQAR